MTGNYEIAVYVFYSLVMLLILITAYTGYRAGFIKEFISLLKIVIPFLVSCRAYEVTGGMLLWIFPGIGDWLYPVAFLATALLTWSIITILSIPLKDLSANAAPNKLSNILGMVPGAFSGVIIVTLLLQFASFFSIPKEINAAVFENPVSSVLLKNSNRFKNKLIPVFEKPLQQYFATTNTVRRFEDSNTLSFVTNIYQTRYDLEMDMIALVNEERRKYGLNPLLPDHDLTVLARQHSADMFEKGYFSHNTPDGQTPFDRMHHAGINYITAGENLALSPTLSLAHTGLMNSLGHRANILNPKYHIIGIGILDGGQYGLMISQEFKD
ncbi:MAG: CvpA family protein [Sphingobacteriales bacterium]|nr:CvpA family protein [Sphingobacteriales bacterium]MBI3718093.1 CvpA family protein [Sphingobacteriales bacterium]